MSAPPPLLERFRAVTGVGAARLEARFDGWSKLALLTDEAVYLFPRRGCETGLRYGAEVSVALSERGVNYVPPVVGRWDDFIERAGPCVAFERRRGHQWSDIEDETSLGDLRDWHEIAELVRDSYRLIAPKKLIAQLDDLGSP